MCVCVEKALHLGFKISFFIHRQALCKIFASCDGGLGKRRSTSRGVSGKLHAPHTSKLHVQLWHSAGGMCVCV